jgi:acetyl esterase/lipase
VFLEKADGVDLRSFRDDILGASLRITMKKQILVFWCAMVGAVPWFQLPILAQNQSSNLPDAIFVDPPRDAANPTRNEAVWIPSGGVLMNGVMYAAAGAGNHPTVLNLHGTPGNEQNVDIAQTLRRAGYNVLCFHYRGAWGSPGSFTQAGGVEDAVAALAFLQDPAVVAKFQIDIKRLIVIGHSYGGFAAARVCRRAPEHCRTGVAGTLESGSGHPAFYRALREIRCRRPQHLRRR